MNESGVLQYLLVLTAPTSAQNIDICSKCSLAAHCKCCLAGPPHSAQTNLLMSHMLFSLPHAFAPQLPVGVLCCKIEPPPS